MGQSPSSPITVFRTCCAFLFVVEKEVNQVSRKPEPYQL